MSIPAIPTRRFRPSVVHLEERVTPAIVPAGFNESLIAEGLQSAIAMTFGPDGSLYVAEQAGNVRIIREGQLRAEPFATVPVGDAGYFGERGLLGLTLDPNFATNRYIYLFYSPPSDTPINRLSRFTAGPDFVDPASETVLFEMPGADGHNGGSIAFGADGKLYIATGDLRQPQNAQSLDNLHGKILRINSDGSIPSDNPFYYVVQGQLRSIWARGFRNPFTFSFQPGTGRMFINDVGELTWEEINEGVAGGNYGWSLHEGPTDIPGFISPVHAYLHPNPPNEGAAITAGVFYNPTTPQFPAEYVGSYFFVDFLAGDVQRIDGNTGEVLPFASEALAVVDMDIGPDGGFYYLDRDRGVIRRIRFQPESPPSFQSEPEDFLAAKGETVRLAGVATGPGPIRYQWLRNGRPISGATSPTLELSNVQLADSGARFQLQAANAFGTTSSREAKLTVLNNRRPTATIQLDFNPAGWAAGESIGYSAAATDAEDGNLPARAFTWEVEYFTGEAARPYVLPTSGIASGTFTAQSFSPFKGTNVFYRVKLTVVDSVGLTFSTFQDVFPRVATVNLESDIPNTILLDGQPITTPLSVAGVVGLVRTLEAQKVVVANGATYRFIGWSNNGDRVQEFPWPSENTTFHARYELVPEGVTIIPPGEPNPALPQVPPPPELPAGTPRFVVGTGAGQVGFVRVFDARGELLTLQPFENAFTGGVRVHSTDVTGDLIDDVLIVPGPGGGPILTIYEGAYGSLLASRMIFEPEFRGGLFVAGGDLNGDGKAEIVLSPDVGGGPRVQILDGDDLTPIIDFFAIDDPNFRGGVRTALGDLNGDGTLDLIVCAGDGGGPRVAIYDGKSLLAGNPIRLVDDFFAFEVDVRGGAVPAAGDMNGDGFSDLIFGAGPGGGPRILALDGRSFLSSNGLERSTIANYFYSDLTLTGGVSVVARDLDGDGRDDLLMGLGTGAAPLVTMSETDELNDQEKPEFLRQFFAFEPELRNGVFVG